MHSATVVVPFRLLPLPLLYQQRNQCGGQEEGESGKGDNDLASERAREPARSNPSCLRERKRERERERERAFRTHYTTTVPQDRRTRPFPTQSVSQRLRTQRRIGCPPSSPRCVLFSHASFHLITIRARFSSWLANYLMERYQFDSPAHTRSERDRVPQQTEVVPPKALEASERLQEEDYVTHWERIALARRSPNTLRYIGSTQKVSTAQ